MKKCPKCKKKNTLEYRDTGLGIHTYTCKNCKWVFSYIEPGGEDE